MEPDLKEKAEEFKGKTEVFITQNAKRGRLAPWLIVLALSAVSVLLLRTSLSAWEKQRELESSLSHQQELLEKMNNRLQEAEDARNSVPAITSEIIKEQLNSLQQLVTQEYIYTNADESESYATWGYGWKRPFSGKSMIITYDGNIKAGIDLREIEIEVDEDAKKITVTLPASAVTDNNIPQESIRIIEVKNGLFNEVTLEDYNSFVSEQKGVMEQRAIDQGLLAKADEQARAAVKAFLGLIPGMEAYQLEVR